MQSCQDATSLSGSEGLLCGDVIGEGIKLRLGRMKSNGPTEQVASQRTTCHPKKDEDKNRANALFECALH